MKVLHALLIMAFIALIYFIAVQTPNSNCNWMNKAKGYPFVTDNSKYFPLPKKATMPPGVGGYGPIQQPQGPSHVMPYPFRVNTGDFLS